MSNGTISGGEIRDVIIIAYVLGLLEMDKEGGTFLSEQDTAALAKIETEIRALLPIYTCVKSKIMKKLEKVSYTIAFSTSNYEVELSVLGLNMLYLNFARNERRGRPLSKTLTNFWDKIEKDCMDLINKHFDGDEDIATDSYNFCIELLEKL